MKKLVFLLALLSTSAFADVLGIINKAVQVKEITREDARAVFLLKERYAPNGIKIQLFRMPLQSKLHREFVRDVLDMSEVQFEREWSKIVNAGLAPEIEEVSTQREMLATVSRKYRSVGYLDKDYIVINMDGTDAVAVRIVP